MIAATRPAALGGETVIGVDIGDGYVAASRLVVSRKGVFRLEAAGWVDYDQRGATPAIVTALRKLWQIAGLYTYTVSTCLRSHSLVLRYFHYPNLLAHELESALWLECEETLQLPREEMAMHWHENRYTAAPGEGPDGREGVLVAAPRSDVTRQLSALEAAGLYPVVMDVACMAVGNLYQALRGTAQAAAPVCLVNLAGRSADILILFDGASIYPRSVFSPTGPWAQTVDYLVVNIHDVLKYYQFKLRRDPVTQVLLTGQVPGDQAFQKRIGEAVGVKVDVWDPLSEIQVKRSKAMQALGSAGGPAMATSLGLALQR